MFSVLLHQRINSEAKRLPPRRSRSWRSQELNQNSVLFKSHGVYSLQGMESSASMSAPGNGVKRVWRRWMHALVSITARSRNRMCWVSNLPSGPVHHSRWLAGHPCFVSCLDRPCFFLLPLPPLPSPYPYFCLLEIYRVSFSWDYMYWLGKWYFRFGQMWFFWMEVTWTAAEAIQGNVWIRSVGFLRRLLSLLCPRTCKVCLGVWDWGRKGR